MYPGHPNRRATFDPRIRNHRLAGRNRMPNHNSMVEDNPSSGNQHFYQQVDPMMPPQMGSTTSTTAQLLVPRVPNNFQAQSDFYQNNPQPFYHNQQSPNMAYGGNLANQTPYLAPPFVEQARTFHPSINASQQPIAAAPSTVISPPPDLQYSLFGYGAPIFQTGQLMASAAAAPQGAFQQHVFSPPGNNDFRNPMMTFAQTVYSDCSEPSDDDHPKDLRMRAVQPPVRNNSGPPVSVEQGATGQTNEVTNHKKFQYRTWTAEPEPTPSTSAAAAAVGFRYVTPCPIPASIAGVAVVSADQLEEMLNGLRLSPYITRDQARSRLLALGNTDEVQREIDNFAAIISCSNYMRHFPTVQNGTMYTGVAPGAGGFNNWQVPAHAEQNQTEETNNSDSVNNE